MDTEIKKGGTDNIPFILILNWKEKKKENNFYTKNRSRVDIKVNKV